MNPTEKTNVIDSRPEMRAELERLLDRHRANARAPGSVHGPKREALVTAL
ncbi:MAG: hypothetical protein HXY25_02975 [Alphaproteobacteria bacterium]|nr:hypothetical protein [Alphaproteobacteria bacterium]